MPLPDDSTEQLTLLLRGAAAGDHSATNQILPLVYEQLKKLLRPA